MPESDLSPECKADLAAYPCSADGYDVFEEIGAGGYAKVYRGRVIATGELVAIKIVKLDYLALNFEDVRKEISIAKSLRHPDICPVLRAFNVDQDLYIVMPLYAAGSCSTIMKQLFPIGFKDDVFDVCFLLSI